MAIDKVSHVKGELAKKSGLLSPREKHDCIFIRCPYHSNGRENTPSCKVNTTSSAAPIGYFYCFGCPEQGSWNKLASTLGMAGFKKSEEVHDIYAFSMPEKPSERTNKLEDYKKLKRWKSEKKWRTIETKTLRKYNARITDDPWYYKDYPLYLPVIVRDKYVGGIYCRRVMNKKLKKQGAISYINTKGKFSKKVVFGYNVAKKMRGPLWIVEGPRDCLKVAQLGGRVVATLGSYFGEDKAKLVEALDPPYIIVASDPDQAGENVVAAIKKLLPMIPQYRVQFPEGRDPANMKQRKFDRIMAQAKKKMRGSKDKLAA